MCDRRVNYGTRLILFGTRTALRKKPLPEVCHTEGVVWRYESALTNCLDCIPTANGKKNLI
jgi:hypothetical protein